MSPAVSTMLLLLCAAPLPASHGHSAAEVIRPVEIQEPQQQPLSKTAAETEHAPEGSPAEAAAAPVPEAATLLLVGTGLLGVAFASRRRLRRIVTGDA